jgi:hypothetical protein
MDSPPSYSFDWRSREHASVTAFLVRQQSKDGIWRALRWGIVIFLALAAAVVLASALLGDLASVLQLGPLTALVGGIVYGFPTITGRLQAWRVARTDPNVSSPIIHTLTASGLQIGMKTISAELRWDGMHSVGETPSMFLFYYNKRRAYYLPKRVVGSPQEVSELKDRIMAHLPVCVPFIPLDPRA